jgi:type II secretory pathway pseudopilin PulG
MKRPIFQPELGMTLLETLIVLLLLSILILLLFNTIIQFLAYIKLNIATNQLAMYWRATRYDAMGGGSQPTTLCMKISEPILFAQIAGSRCENVTQWSSLTHGVAIDTSNSTLRTVAGIAGNGGTIYRVSWADTRSGYGGSYGQLGKIVLMSPGTGAKRCLVLFNTDGTWNIRQNSKCQR